MSTLSPEVSVLLAVYNGERHIREAIESVLAQDSDNWELVIVDDGSTDSTPQLLSAQTDPRIRVLRTENQGLTKALNYGLQTCVGQFVARLDADDRCLPERIRLQADFLKTHPNVVAVGASFYEVLVQHMIARVCEPPKAHADCRAELLQGRSVFLHSSVMFRRTLEGEPIRYDESYREAQDQRLWIQLAARSQLGSIEKPLVVALRNDPESITARRTLVKEVRLKTRLIKAAHDELNGSHRHASWVIARMALNAVLARVRQLVRLVVVSVIGEHRLRKPQPLTWSEVNALWGSKVD